MAAVSILSTDSLAAATALGESLTGRWWSKTSYRRTHPFPSFFRSPKEFLCGAVSVSEFLVAATIFQNRVTEFHRNQFS